jgi:uncharacterized protein YecE (DUF72 family)
MESHSPRQLNLFAPDSGATESQGPDRLASSSLLVGCAGWSLASAVQPSFPSYGTHLERYSQVFSAVEINSSFYRQHRAATYARWRDSVSDGFRFSVKVPRTVTHRLHLQNADADMLEFLEAVEYLNYKLGCLLVQLPPDLGFDPIIARDFFCRLRSRVAVDIACEPRHASWGALEADELFSQFNIVRVFADPQVVSPRASGSHPDIGNTVYIRLHGNPEIYHSPYSNEFLQRLASEVAEHARQGRRAWCIFDNTASGAAVPNALHLVKCIDALAKEYWLHA